MSKLKDIIIINAHTIQLNQDAKKGDIIDLNTIEHIDASLLNKKIEEAMETSFKTRLESYKNQWNIKLENEIQKAIKEKEETIAKLKQQIESNEKSIRLELDARYQKQIQQLQNKIQSLNQEKENEISKKKMEIDLEVSKKANELNQTLNEYKNQVDKLKNDYQVLTERSKLELENAVQKKVQELNERIVEKDKQISKLTLEKSTLNIKQMGEELESWVNQEYLNHAMNGFETCIWEKDNIAIKDAGESKGTKADYLFKVYATESMDSEGLLTSVACEIKSEDPNSTYKKKNSDHYEKLDKDRQKKHCEYALLISELEWDSPNDAPIRKVQGYEKMYMVRPQYFIVFLNLVTAIALQYKELVTGYNVERAKFKDAESIKSDFEAMKDQILDRSLKYIDSQIKDIDESAEKIEKEAKKIRESARIVMDTHLRTVVNKIENFNINQVINQINQLENNQSS